MILTSIDKAQAINNGFRTPVVPGEDEKPAPINYRGAIAEIGAGQEVSRHFFEALGSSKTIEKTMSAYGKAASNAIYEKEGVVLGNFISEARLERMIDYDYRLLMERTQEEKPSNVKKSKKTKSIKPPPRRYFTFGNTVDINKDGWAGVRVQEDGDILNPTKRDHFALEYRIHFNVLANDKVSKIRTVGSLGVNIIYAALLNALGKFPWGHSFVASLMENIEGTSLRIDSIAVHRYYVRFDSSCPTPKISSISAVDKEKYGRISQCLCIELVKTNAVRCATFKVSNSASIPTYFSIDKTEKADGKHGRFLIFTRAASSVRDISLELEMMKVCREAFMKDLSAQLKCNIGEELIDTAIQIPVLAISENLRSSPYIYYTRADEPDPVRKKRRSLIKAVPTDEIAKRIELITQGKSIAYLSEFMATSEMVKYLREKTRLNMESASKVHNMAFVLRADQLVELLINIEHRVVDRDALEIIGSIIRRRVMVYIYPCLYSVIFEGKTRYGTPIFKAFRESQLKEYKTRNRLKHPVTVEQLEADLLPEYSSLIRYIKVRNCISNLDPIRDDFMKTPLAPSA